MGSWDLLPATRSRVSIEKCSCDVRWKTWQPRWQRYIPLVYLPQNKTSTQRLIPTSIKAPLKILFSCVFSVQPQTWTNLELICTNGRSHSVQFLIFSTAFTLIHIFRQYCWSTTTMLVNRCNHQVPVKILGHVHWAKTKGLLPGSIALVFASLWLRFLEVEGNVQRCN